jgi:replicative DNA helicase
MSEPSPPDIQTPPARRGNGEPALGEGQRRQRDWRHLSSLFEQLPPHSLESEMSLLGAMLIDPQVVGDVVLVVRSGNDFFKPTNGAIYDAMVELYDRHAALDIVLLHQLLNDRGTLDSVGGLNYLVELANAVPSAANALHYARDVRQKAAVRQLIDAAGDVLYDAYHSPEDAQVILERAEQAIFRIAQQSEHSHAETLQALVEEAMRLMEDNDGKLITGVPTGFRDLDEMTQGLQRGEMIIIAARPSMGKTALALNMAELMALRDHPVGIFSLEMSRQQLVQRLLAAKSGVNSQKIRRSMLNSDDYHKLHIACGELMDAQILIDDTPGLTPLQLRAKARRMVAKHDIKAIFIDYLQLMSVGGRVESRQVEISEISRSIKAMARELNVPVICLSQLNRAPEQREGHRPRMSDLRESGSLEQDADVVMMLHREDYYHQGEDDWADRNPDKLGVAELIITKQRNGPTGNVTLTWASEITRFRDYSPASSGRGYDDRSSAGSYGRHFSPGPRKGPAEDFRDGGGPERDEVDDIPI